MYELPKHPLYDWRFFGLVISIVPQSQPIGPGGRRNFFLIVARFLTPTIAAVPTGQWTHSAPDPAGELHRDGQLLHRHRVPEGCRGASGLYVQISKGPHSSVAHCNRFTEKQPPACVTQPPACAHSAISHKRVSDSGPQCRSLLADVLICISTRINNRSTVQCPTLIRSPEVPRRVSWMSCATFHAKDC